MQLLGRGVNGYTTLLLEINTIFQFDLYIVMGRGIFCTLIYDFIYLIKSLMEIMSIIAIFIYYYEISKKS